MQLKITGDGIFSSIQFVVYIMTSCSDVISGKGRVITALFQTSPIRRRNCRLHDRHFRRQPESSECTWVIRNRISQVLLACICLYLRNNKFIRCLYCLIKHWYEVRCLGIKPRAGGEWLNSQHLNEYQCFIRQYRHRMNLLFRF